MAHPIMLPSAYLAQICVPATGTPVARASPVVDTVTCTESELVHRTSATVCGDRTVAVNWTESPNRITAACGVTAGTDASGGEPPSTTFVAAPRPHASEAIADAISRSAGRATILSRYLWPIGCAIRYRTPVRRAQPLPR